MGLINTQCEGVVVVVGGGKVQSLNRTKLHSTVKDSYRKARKTRHFRTKEMSRADLKDVRDKSSLEIFMQ